MRRRSLAIGIVFLFICSAFIPMSLGYNKRNTMIKQSSNISNGNILYVGGSGLGNYTKIQDAIDNASDGDTVFVFDDSSPYFENIVINTSISLIGENKDTTIIDGNKIGNVVLVNADLVNISGFSIQNSREGIGIVLRANHISLVRNNVSNNSLGIYQDFYTKYAYINISENSILNNEIGLGILWLDNCTISNNKFINNDESIVTLTCSNSTFIGNNFSKNYKGIGLSYSRNNIIIDNKFLNNNQSITISLSEHNAILDNSFLNNYLGIMVFDSFNNTIIDNNISNSHMGILFVLSHNNTILNNDVTNNEYGVYFLHSVLNFMKGNYITNSINDGLLFLVSNNNSVTKNFIANNNIGINLSVFSNDNIITENNIMYNLDGIIASDSNRDNRIYHNNLINEDNNAWDYGNNIWDDGKYGNYWDDYKEKCPDAKPKLFKPWIWNTPYEIEGDDNKDMCPLVNQWPDPRSRTITRITPSFSSFWLRFIDMFPIL